MCCYLVEIFFSSFRNHLVVLVRAAFDLHKQSHTLRLRDCIESSRAGSGALRGWDRG